MNEIGMICQRLLEYITIHKEIFVNNSVQIKKNTIHLVKSKIDTIMYLLFIMKSLKMFLHVFAKTSLLIKMKNILKSFWELEIYIVYNKESLVLILGYKYWLLA